MSEREKAILKVGIRGGGCITGDRDMGHGEGRGDMDYYGGHLVAESIIDPAVARRLAACWNACAGISTEALETLAAGSDVLRLSSLAIEAQTAAAKLHP